ncbi:MAG: sporulation protein YabP [Ruminococcaceae bacterium]|nr:sporulation protein YabP [Oscillospiraceae bacterium]
MANEANRNHLHELRLENREKLTVNSVQEVESFDENTVALLTDQGLLVIRGENLQLKSLSPEGGQVCVNGVIHSIDYEEARKAGGFLKRLFG